MKSGEHRVRGEMTAMAGLLAARVERKRAMASFDNGLVKRANGRVPAPSGATAGQSPRDGERRTNR
jgi:hypothetical protein